MWLWLESFKYFETSFTPNIWFIFDALCVTEMNVYFSITLWSVQIKSFKLINFVVQIFYTLIFCLLFLLVIEKWVFKSKTVIVTVSIFTLSSKKVLLYVFWNTLIRSINMYSWYIFLNNWPFSHFEMISLFLLILVALNLLYLILR